MGRRKEIIDEMKMVLEPDSPDEVAVRVLSNLEIEGITLSRTALEKLLEEMGVSPQMKTILIALFAENGNSRQKSER